MISYEATLGCDKCKAMVAGGPSTHFMHTRASAIEVASKRGWIIRPRQFGGCDALCPDCQEKPHGGTTNGENSEGNQTG